MSLRPPMQSAKVAFVGTAIGRDALQRALGNDAVVVTIGSERTLAAASAVDAVVAEPDALSAADWPSGVDSIRRRFGDKPVMLLTQSLADNLTAEDPRVHVAENVDDAAVALRRAVLHADRRPGADPDAAQDLLHTILHCIPLGVIALDRNHCVREWNAAAEKLFGWTRDEVLGEPLPTIPDDERGEAEAGIAASLRGEHGRIINGRRLCKDGSMKIVQGWTSPHVNAAGRVIGAIGFFADPQEQDEAMTQLQRQREELAHLLRFQTVGEVATNLAHELNQPLGAILNYAGVCLDRINGGDTDPAALSEALNDIVNETNRANQIIRRIRGFLRKRTSGATAFGMNDAARDAVQLVDANVERAGVELLLDLDDRQPRAVGDPVQIAQIVVNLLNNALDALADVPAKRRKLAVRTRQVSPTAVELATLDQGPGVSPETLPHIFEPFYTTRPEGLGMGLAISRTLAEAHGGRLEAKPREGGGMCFTLTLPAAQDRKEGER